MTRNRPNGLHAVFNLLGGTYSHGQTAPGSLSGLMDGGTEFCLISEQVLAGSKSEKSMADGSRFIVENFKAYVETGKVTFGARMTLAMYSLMAPMTPKAMRAETWPLDKAE